MAKKLYFIYTNPEFKRLLYSPVMAQAFDGRDDVEVYFTLDDSLARDSVKNGMNPTNSIIRRLFYLAENCALGGADCVVVGCSVINTAVKQIERLTSIPLIELDEPMVQKICGSGAKKIALVSPTEAHALMTQRRIKAEIGSDAQIKVVVVPNADHARQNQDTAQYEKLMKDAVLTAAQWADAIALPHISCDTLSFDEVGVPIFHIGACCIDQVFTVLGLPPKSNC